MSFNSTRALEIVKYFTEDIDDPFNLIPVLLITLCFAWCGFPSGKTQGPRLVGSLQRLHNSLLDGSVSWRFKKSLFSNNFFPINES